MPRAALPALLGIAGMVLAILVGPYFSHPDYSSLMHRTSQMAGQNMPNAWIMRTGFLAFGAGVLISALMIWSRGRVIAGALAVFGAAMAGVGLWSAAPIDPAMGFDPAEDMVHSMMANVMGTAFCVAAVARLWRAGWPGHDGLSWIAAVASIALPLAMLQFPDVAGAMQRAMFAISFLWIGRQVMGR